MRKMWLCVAVAWRFTAFSVYDVTAFLQRVYIAQNYGVLCILLRPYNDCACTHRDASAKPLPCLRSYCGNLSVLNFVVRHVSAEKAQCESLARSQAIVNNNSVGSRQIKNVHVGQWELRINALVAMRTPLRLHHLENIRFFLRFYCAVNNFTTLASAVVTPCNVGRLKFYILNISNCYCIQSYNKRQFVEYFVKI